MYIRTLVAAETYEGIINRRKVRDKEEAEMNAKKYAESQLAETAPVQEGSGAINTS